MDIVKDELLSDSIRSPSRLNYRDESSGAISNSGDTTFGRRWNNRDSSKKHNRRRNKVSSRSKSGYKWKPSFGFIHLRVFHLSNCNFQNSDEGNTAKPCLKIEITNFTRSQGWFAGHHVEHALIQSFFLKFWFCCC